MSNGIISRHMIICKPLIETLDFKETGIYRSR